MKSHRQSKEKLNLDMESISDLQEIDNKGRILKKVNCKLQKRAKSMADILDNSDDEDSTNGLYILLLAGSDFVINFLMIGRWLYLILISIFS